MKGLRHVRYWIFSLLISVLLWSVANSTSPVERPFDVPVKTIGVPEDLVVVGQDYDRVNIRVRGSRAGLASLTATDLVYEADLSSAEKGQNQHEIDITRISRELPRGADVVSRAPLSIDFVLEPKLTRSLMVEASIEGEPAPGFRVESVTLSPNRVTVVGARSEVSALKAISTQKITINGLQNSLRRKVLLEEIGRHSSIVGAGEVEVFVQILAVPEEEEATAPVGRERR